MTFHEPELHIRPLAKAFAFERPDAKAGLVLVHGFGDSPYSMRSLGRLLHDDGYDVRVPRLPGHGSRLEHFYRARLDDWRWTVRSELELLRSRHGPNVVLLGRSFGGVLSLLELAEHPNAAAGIILVATPQHIGAERLLRRVLPVLGLVKKNVKKPWVKPHERVSRLETGRYEHFPIPALRECLRGITQLTPEFLSRITVPTLILHGDHDRIAAPQSASYFYDHIGSTDKRLVMVPSATHAAEILHNDPLFLRELLAFLGRIFQA
ncbi:MAG: alpha/beta fold hydrolase [Candidatus Kerfeldbacteria bacterium]|nr:alpha/beta fold hydrolase [Candidatus Kerfeldbacteria bacterium]